MDNPDANLPQVKQPDLPRRRAPFPLTAVWLAALAVLPWLASCAVELENLQPAKEYAESSREAGSVYAGWRVFEQRCAACHGHGATGTAQAPDLLPALRTMGPRSFVGKVLRRYDWNIPAASSRDREASLDALIEQIMLREQGLLTMPAWEGDPQVSAHIMDLYAYLAARSEGSQGAGRPVQ